MSEHEQTDIPRRPARSRLQRWGALALALVIGGSIGGWQRYQATDGLTATRQNQVAVRLSYDVTAPYLGGCNKIPIAASIELPVPLVNYSPGPIDIRSASLDVSGTASTPQKLSVTIGAGKTVLVNLTVPSSLCQAVAQGCGPTPETVLYATFALIPLSKQVHNVELPVGAWDPPSLLTPYEDADFSHWSSWSACPTANTS